LNDGNAPKIKEYTNELLELLKGVTTKVKKVSQAKTLVFSIEKRLSGKVPNEERRRIEEAVKRLEVAPYTDVGKEANSLKEMITLLEAAYGEK
jgi:hypothetical protein